MIGDLRRWLPLVLVLMGCVRATPFQHAPRHDALDVVLVPGCPTRADGQLSICQQERVAWALELYEQGLARHLLVSGAAVATPYVEAESLAQALRAAGVPASRIWTETQARHTDQNAGFSLAIVNEMGWERVGIATHEIHTRLLFHMMDNWGVSATPLPLDTERVQRRLSTGLPRIASRPVRPWHPPESPRHRARRPPSWWLYASRGVLRRFFRFSPPAPPEREPTLPTEPGRTLGW